MEAMRAIAHGKPMLDEVMDKVNKQAYKVDFLLFCSSALLLFFSDPEKNCMGTSRFI